MTSGRGHWRWQRLTAMALLPLTLWLLWSLYFLQGTGFVGQRAWFAAPLHAVLLAALLVCLCWHSWLGVQVVIEDYVPSAGAQRTSLWVSCLVHAALLIVGGYAIACLVLKGLN